MSNFRIKSISFILSILCCFSATVGSLIEKPFSELPLGTVKAEGWLQEQLQRAANGMTGNLDTLYPEVCGPRNAWLGGDGDCWERGPYWLDGLYPLAHILDDEALKAKASEWVEWTLANQRPNGQIGPYPLENKDRTRKPPPGAQVDNAQDWWPRMVMLKVLMQHYSATKDPRVIECLTRYFQFQLGELPNRPLFTPGAGDGSTWWARQRGGDNLMAIYWLYNITGDDFLLELGDLVHSQTTPYTREFLEGKTIPQIRYEGSGEGFDYTHPGINAYHCVNLAQGMKAPIIRYQADRDPRHLQAVKKAFADVEHYHGQPHGLYGADEGMHGRSLTRGSELCTTVEMMFSLEKIIEITGEVEFADRLEMVAYNLLPTQISDDFMARQYFQQANQINATYGDRNFHNDYGDRVVYGLTSGYPCCTANLHQAWPKFVHHLWMASADGGLAALVYGPSSVSKKIGGHDVTIHEQTNYPMEDQVRFVVKSSGEVNFPLHLRIPGWCEKPVVTVNHNKITPAVKDGIAVIRKAWKSGDEVILKLPNQVRVKRWHEYSASVYWGPLLFALKMEETWSDRDKPSPQGRPYREARSTTPWNVTMLEPEVANPKSFFKVAKEDPRDTYFWNVENAPLSIKVNGYIHEHWKQYKEDAGPIPFSPQNPSHRSHPWDIKPINFELIPYGCTTLRISAFPTIRRPK